MVQKRLNIIEFAREVGVSIATVSRAFKPSGKIRKETKAQITQMARKLGYTPNIHARNLVLKKTNTLALFYPAPPEINANYYFSELILGISETVADAEMYLQIHIIPKRQKSVSPFYRDILFNGSVDGLIFVDEGGCFSMDLKQILDDLLLPYVIIGNNSSGRNIVASDIKGGACKAGRYLRKIGCSHPAYVGGINDGLKILGFMEGLEDFHRILFMDRGGSTFNDGVMAFDRIFSSHPEVDGVLCANDILAIGVIHAASKRGIKVPDVLSVIGCDDLSIAAFYSPSLTSIKVPKFDIGKTAVAELLKLINNEQQNIEKILDCELVLRESA